MRSSQLIKDVADGLVELAWPIRCVWCDRPGALVCDDCNRLLPLIDVGDACPLCGAPFGAHVCTECWTGQGRNMWEFSESVSAMEFSGVAARIVVCYKDQGEMGLAQIMAQLMAASIRIRWDQLPGAITYVPSTPKAYARRGFDHMELLAKKLGAQLGIPIASALQKRDSQDQRDLGKDDRAANMRNAICVSDDSKARGLVLGVEKLMLIDDVFTTGATLNAASRALMEIGVRDVVVATFCRVW